MLNFISSPIGNLNDISLRSINVLKNSDYIFSEDTRVSSKLLNFAKINKKPISFHEHNEKTVTKRIISLLKDDKEVSIMCDAGMPAISDPGFFLIKECIKEDLKFTVIPGPSSVLNALVLSGISTASFIFLGFMPKKESKRNEYIDLIKNEQKTIILFESAKRISSLVKLLNSNLENNRNIALCREMTKVHEQVVRGSIKSIYQEIEGNKIILKGEFVIVIEGTKTRSFKIDNKMKKAFLEKMQAKDAAKLISLITKENKRDVYKDLLDL